MIPTLNARRLPGNNQGIPTRIRESLGTSAHRQSHGKETTMKWFTTIVSLGVAIGLLLTTRTRPAFASSDQSGDIRITKECSQYTGAAGSFCTITSSNLARIPAGTK